jgi:hypothetical protein
MKIMMVYIVVREHKCDDPYYQAGPSFEGVYATEQLAQAAVDAYIDECKREYQQELDEHTVEIEGRTYRWCDLHDAVDDEAAGTRRYTYKPMTEIDMEDFWHRYPQQHIRAVEVQTGESK